MDLPAMVPDASAPGLCAETRPARPASAIKNFFSVLINRYYTGCRPGCPGSGSLRQEHRIRTADSLQEGAVAEGLEELGINVIVDFNDQDGPVTPDQLEHAAD